MVCENRGAYSAVNQDDLRAYCSALLASLVEKPGDQTPRLLIGEDGVHTEALDLRSGAVSTRGEAIPWPRPAQVDNLKTVIE
jgi:hypothetical protein